jgi:hypothetical protein
MREGLSPLASSLSQLQEVGVELAAAPGGRDFGRACAFSAGEVPLETFRFHHSGKHKVSFPDLG